MSLWWIEFHLIVQLNFRNFTITKLAKDESSKIEIIYENNFRESLTDNNSNLQKDQSSLIDCMKLKIERLEGENRRLKELVSFQEQMLTKFEEKLII